MTVANTDLDQTVDGKKLFQVYGHSIGIGKDGRRLWPAKFKQQIGRKVISGKLSTQDVQKACQISSGGVNQCVRFAERGSNSRNKKGEADKPVFTEIKLVPELQAISASVQRHLKIKTAKFELCLPADYPVERIIQLLTAVGSPR